MASSLSSPYFKWRNRFFRAMKQRQPDVLELLLKVMPKDMRKEGPDTYQKNKPTLLGLAIERIDDWGVAWLLQQGEPLQEVHLDHVFKEIEASRQASALVGSFLVKRLWPVLLPHVLASEMLCQCVVKHYFRSLRDGRLADGVDWDALAMGQVTIPLVDTAFLDFEGTAVTPLQNAFLLNCPLTTQGLLRTGANPQAFISSSGLPGWSLESALCHIFGGVDYLQTGTGEVIKAYVKTEWAVTSEVLIEKMPRLFTAIAFMGLSTRELNWEHVQAQVDVIARAKELEKSLPPASPVMKRGPRF